MIFARFQLAIKSKQDGKIWLKLCFPGGGGGGGSEIKCIIFKENNDNPFDNPHDIFLPDIFYACYVILCIISNLSGVVHGHFLVKYYT